MNDIGKERSDNLKNKGRIMNGGLFNYARYGDKLALQRASSPAQELASVKAEELTALIKGTEQPPAPHVLLRQASPWTR